MLITNAITFYFIGKYIERFKWNNLIKRGLFPKPKNKC